MPLLIEATINDVVHRVSTDSVALAHYWLPYVISFDAPNFDATKDYGGFCEITFGSISFHPDLFSGDWFPPDKIQLNIKYTESTEAAAAVVFLAVAYLSKVDNDSVSYDIRNAEYDKQILTECVDYDGNENIPVPCIIGTIQHAEPVRITNIGSCPRYRIDGIVLDNPEIQISGIAFYDTVYTRITTHSAHGFSSGDSIIISDTKDFNGTYVVSWVSAYTFLIEKAFNPGVPLYQIASFEEYPIIGDFIDNDFEGGFDDYTVSLLHFDGVDESTNFTDASGKTWTAYDGAKLDTSEKKFGTASGLFDGAGDYISTPGHTDFNFGTGDFTIDFWFWVTAYNPSIGTFGMVDFNTWSANGLSIGICGPSGYVHTYYLGVYICGTEYQFACAEPATSEWHHLAVCRSGTDLLCFINGVQVGSTLTSSDDIQSTLIQLGFSGPYADYMDGKLDEFRVSKGIARWTANFTPPTTAYTKTELSDNWTYTIVNFDAGTPHTITKENSIVHDGTVSVKVEFGACGWGSYCTIKQDVPASTGTNINVKYTISVWVYWDGTEILKLTAYHNALSMIGLLYTDVHPMASWQQVSLEVDGNGYNIAFDYLSVYIFIPATSSVYDGEVLYIDGPISIAKAGDDYTRVTLESGNPFQYDPSCRIIGTTNYDGQYNAIINTSSTFVIQKSYTTEVLDGVSEKAYIYTHAVTSLVVTGHVVDALTATPFRVYDDGVPITDNYVAVTSTFQSFALEAEPVGKLTISGTGSLTTFDDVLDAAATIAGITYDNTSARAVSPGIADIIDTQLTIIDYISAICEFYTHVAYVLDSVLYAIDCKRVNQANPSGISLSEHEFFDVNYYGKFSLSEIKSEWTVQRMTVHSIGDNIYVLSTVDRIARSNLTLVSSGIITDISALKLMDVAATFIADGVSADMFAKNFDTGEIAQVTVVNSETQLTLNEDIFSILATTEWETGVVWETGIVWGFNDLPEYIVGSMFSSGDDISVKSYHQEVENVQLALYDIQSILVSYKIEVSLPMNALKWILPGDMLKFTDTKKPQDLDIEMKVKSLKYDFDNYTLIATGDGTIS